MGEAGIEHGGGIGEAARRYGGAASDWLDLSTGINPVPAPLPDIPMAAWQRLPDSGLVAVGARGGGGLLRRCRRAAASRSRQSRPSIQHLPMLVDGAVPRGGAGADLW